MASHNEPDEYELSVAFDNEPEAGSEAAATLRPRVFASGHVHDAHGVGRAPWGLEVRASVCDGLYRAVQLPVVVDVPVRDPPGPFSCSSP